MSGASLEVLHPLAALPGERKSRLGLDGTAAEQVGLTSKR